MKATIDHSARKHAVLSPSGAKRWMTCTVSPRLEEAFENTTSGFAEEGTLAHEFAELGTRLSLNLLTKEKYDSLTKPFFKSEHYSDEMDEMVKIHIDYVLEQFTEAKRKNAGAILLIEDRVDLTEFIEEGSGTCDDIIISDGTMEVIDLKYGKGVRVSANDNDQLKLYGLGALSAYELMYDIHTVKLTIVQPRLDSIDSWEISAADLKRWGEEEVRPKAKLAYAGEGEQVPGDHCKFCKVKPRCAALAAQNLELAKLDFADPMLLTDDQLIEVYKKSSMMTDWLGSISEYLLKEAVSGHKFPEYKLVEGRSNRVFTDKEKVKTILLEADYKEADILKSDLQGIGAIEKLLTQKVFNILLEDYIVKPPGKPTLVPESDKRPEFGLASAQNDFKS